MENFHTIHLKIIFSEKNDLDTNKNNFSQHLMVNELEIQSKT